MDEWLRTIAAVGFGSLLTYILDTSGWRRTEALSARIELLRVLDVMWDHRGMSKLAIQLGTIEAKCTALGFDRAVVQRVAQAA